MKISLPEYTVNEERFNMISHIVGGGLGVVMLTLSVVFAALSRNPWTVVGCAIYGGGLVTVYAVSSVYHGLHKNKAKQVMRVIDHCAIYLLIAGTYTPIIFGALMPVAPVTAWILFGVVWGLASLAITLTAVDMKKYSVFSMICYIGIGWSVLFAFDTLLKAVATGGVIFLLLGGIVYSLGAILYGVGKKIKYMHSIFHLFVVVGSLLQFMCIFFYVI